MGKKITVLRVVSQREGFRRAGFTFGRTPVDLTQDMLDKEKFLAIVNDPMLVAVQADIDAPEDGTEELWPEPASKAATIAADLLGTTAIAEDTAKPAKK